MDTLRLHQKKSKPRPPLFRALGSNEPPESIEVDGQPYRLQEVLKHDSWAATAIYRGLSKQLICKFNRVQSIGVIDMKWLGKRLASRERKALEMLSDLPNLPKPCKEVRVDGIVAPNAAAREFLDGHPLTSGEIVNGNFFPELKALLAAMHTRGLAYVDLHKRENIIVGDDGKPYLIDFQICFDATNPRIRWIPGIKTLLNYLCRSDDYHLLKHVIKHRPEQAAIAEKELDAVRPWWIKAHRLIAKPFRQMRRKLLVKTGVRTGIGMASSEQFAEDAVRREMALPQKARRAA